MAVIRINKTKDYTVMSNTHFREKMSLKAKGLLSLMLSLPDNWDYSVAGLVAICIEKESAINSTLNELKKFGYLRVDKLMPNQTASGRIEYIYNIFETPEQIEIQQSGKQRLEKQDLENQGVEFQGVENQGQYNTKESNTKKKNTNKPKINDNKERKIASNSFDILIEKYLSDDGIRIKYQDADERRDLLKEWLKVRKAKRAAMTDRAIELNLKKLDSLAFKSNMSVVDYLKEVICRGWQAFYEIKDYSNSSKEKDDNNSFNGKRLSELTQKEYEEYLKKQGNSPYLGRTYSEAQFASIFDNLDEIEI